MAHFKKKSANTKQDVPTSAMPDVVFMLLIFFMVTTVLREVELKVQIDYTQAENIEKIEQKRLVSYIYIGPERLGPTEVGESKVQIDDAIVEDINAIRTIMYDKLMEQPRLIVSLRVDRDSDFGLITDVTQELRHAGTLRINYSTKREI
ncbi:MAG TPA: biopolymer transporter ExbD [Bacteroidetes bacterium]|jgi:biopolymer transport protein ExbD|nr:MAG: biopolymer transporter ExbD [Rhodothermaeota bacterium MED-G64]RPF78870.1 MAG: biopolymer transporter ExbD [Rhodothermaceae bacterium TMED105]HBD43050.1 biopolymer transporter ExbD [Bacteroidota bacterium]HBW00080.1 biopolymer transporter ExbD [Bacteroidota bacterium]|tara:strand:- start:618 stop:1064 length:447 start_codon:yes stop_codon:yes gene_type:complete